MSPSLDLTLTFDNGPDPEVTPYVLDILREHGILTTFFVIGSKLARAQDWAIAAHAHAQGHWVGNHTWSHSVPFGMHKDRDFAIAEITRTEEAIGGLSHARRYFRPYGEGGQLGPHLLSPLAVDELRKRRMTCVLWNAIPRDWADPDGWVERALEQVLAQRWTLMVLHDLPTGAMRRLDAFLEKAAGLGIRLRQEFPPDCMPIVEGRIVHPVDEYIAR
jgi:peptidoglycan/xylan/chitin deacetylase (PgdA/CDA1 family)